MRVLESAVQFSSQNARLERVEVRESLRVTVGLPPPSAPRDVVAVSAEATGRAGEIGRDEDPEPPLDPDLELLRLILERLTGRTIKAFAVPKAEGAPPGSDPAARRPAQPAVDIAYDRVERRIDAEQTQVQARGVVRTSDGKEIAFALDMQLARARVETTEVHLRAGNGAATDPLVINFGRPAADLAASRISFDLDGDGDRESIAGLAPGSGWLALDRDGDGRITSGRELFGPSTGSGYGELAAEDADGSGWIDEADPVFARLVLVTGQSPQELQTRTLASAGIAAIGLAHGDAPFTYQAPSGEVLGVARAAGVYLGADGRVGTTQQVDLVV